MGYGGRQTSQFQSDVRLVFGNPSTTVYSDAYVLRLINFAYITDVCMNFDLPNLVRISGSVSLTAGEYRFAVDSVSALKIFDVIRTSDYQPLERSSFNDFDRFQLEQSTNTGTPEKWCESYQEDETAQPCVAVWPRAASATTFVVRYKARPTALSGATDVTILSNEWDDVITDFARARFARDLRLPADADMWMQSAQFKAMSISPNLIRASDTRWTLPGHGALK